MTISATLQGEDQFSPALNPSILLAIPDRVNSQQYIDLSIGGVWTGTLTLQRRFSGDSSWRDTDYITDNVETYFRASLDAQYRVGFRVGDYESGTALVRLGIGY